MISLGFSAPRDGKKAGAALFLQDSSKGDGTRFQSVLLVAEQSRNEINPDRRGKLSLAALESRADMRE